MYTSAALCVCVLCRKLNKLTKFIESQKEKFTQLDLQDVEVREKLKHTKSKTKKLQKQLQKDKEKVRDVSICHPLSTTRLYHHDRDRTGAGNPEKSLMFLRFRKCLDLG